MIRLFKHYISPPLIVLTAVELLILYFSMFAGVVLRDVWGDVELEIPEDLVSSKALLFTLVMFTSMTIFGLHQRNINQLDEWEEVVRFVISFIAGLIVMLLIFYIFPTFHRGRGAFGIGFLVAIVGTALVRFVFSRLFHLESISRRILLLGSGSRSAKIEDLERDERGTRKFNLVGCLPLGDRDCCLDKSKIINDKDSILSIVNKYKIDEIVVGVRDRRSGGIPTKELLECKLAGINVVDLSSFFERETGKIQVESLNPSWMIFSDGFHRSSAKDITKHTFDIAASITLFLLTLPVMVITALLIWIESGSPVFYRQERVGENGRIFHVLKFRSMHHDAEKDGVPRWASLRDHRVTRVGRVIRKLRIDELLQIFNILSGDMSFVGPRPERPYFVKELTKKIPYYPSRHAVKPGITGWAQIHYPYGATVDDAMEKLQYDLYYVKNHTLFLDLIILLQTAQVIIFGKGAR